MAGEPIKLDPDPLAPYRISPGFKVDGMLYLSGHAAISESGELVGVGDFDAQAQATFESLQRTLGAVVHCALPRRHHCRGVVAGLARTHDRN